MEPMPIPAATPTWTAPEADPWLTGAVDQWDLDREAAKLAREQRMEKHRPTAEAAHLAVLARYYGKDTMTPEQVPAYKGPGTHEWTSGVEQQMRRLLDAETPRVPVPPFVDADWSGTSIVRDERQQAYIQTASGRLVRADDRIERALDGHIAEATRHHDLHDEHVHPWCRDCDVREARSSVGDVDLQHASLTDAEIRVEGMERLEERVRSYLLEHAGKAPEHPVTMEPEVVRSPWRSLSELKALPPVPWLVDGLVPEGRIGYLTGRDGVFKTFFALDLALSVVTGTSFHGRDVTEVYGGAVYVAGEGGDAFGARVRAWEAARGVVLTETDEEYLPIYDRGVNLFTGGPEFDGFLARVKEQQPALVVFDTLQRCAAGADQNSAGDMALVSARLDLVRRATSGAVLVVAHTGKSDQDARGSSSIEDDADFVIHMSRKEDEQVVAVKVTKQKDGAEPPAFLLTVEQHADSIALVATTAMPGMGPLNIGLELVGLMRLAAEPLTNDELYQMLNADRDRKINPGSVRNNLATLVRDGKVHKTEAGTTRGAKSRYWVDPEGELPTTVVPS